MQKCRNVFFDLSFYNYDKKIEKEKKQIHLNPIVNEHS